MAKLTFTFDTGEARELFGDDETLKLLFDRATALHGFTEKPVEKAPRYDHGQAYMRPATPAAPAPKRQKGQL